jgi:hypothetical protein
MRTYLLLVLTDITLLLFTVWYLSISDTLFLLTPLVFLVLIVGFIAALLLVGLRILQGKESAVAAYVALVGHVLIGLVVVYGFQHETYIDIAFHNGLTRREAIVTGITHSPANAGSITDWEPYQNGYWSPSQHVVFEGNGDAHYVLFTITRDLWDFAGFLYVSRAEAEPQCLSSSYIVSSVKRMRDQWYWIRCAGD